MHDVLLRYSLDGDDGSVTTSLSNDLSKLHFVSAGTGLVRARQLSASDLSQLFAILGKYSKGQTNSKGALVTVDHFIVVVEP